MIERQRTFYDYENKAYEWLEHLRQVFDVKKSVIVEHYDKKHFIWKWTVFVRFK